MPGHGQRYVMRYVAFDKVEGKQIGKPMVDDAAKDRVRQLNEWWFQVKTQALVDHVKRLQK